MPKRLGVTIKQVGFNVWEIQTRDGALIRSSLETCLPDLQRLRIPIDEVILALDSAEKNGHNLIEFGTYGTFLFSKFEGLNQ
jgi:hypothetical protein